MIGYLLLKLLTEFYKIFEKLKLARKQERCKKIQQFESRMLVIRFGITLFKAKMQWSISLSNSFIRLYRVFLKYLWQKREKSYAIFRDDYLFQIVNYAFIIITIIVLYLSSCNFACNKEKKQSHMLLMSTFSSAL